MPAWHVAEQPYFALLYKSDGRITLESVIDCRTVNWMELVNDKLSWWHDEPFLFNNNREFLTSGYLSNAHGIHFTKDFL
jgi:hypothetical protein